MKRYEKEDHDQDLLREAGRWTKQLGRRGSEQACSFQICPNNKNKNNKNNNNKKNNIILILIKIRLNF